ncbi:histone H3-K79 methyltransferase [Phytophthora cactorum]|nr:histone H3-K79 methyltransferase [Phytophthora cactorum]
MRRTKRSTKGLEKRLRALQRTYGRRLAGFPRCFFSKLIPREQLISPPRARNGGSVLESDVAQNVLEQIFNTVTKKDVYQAAGFCHFNVGELLPSAVPSLIRSIRDISKADVFADIGPGVGNVVAQVAHETPARLCRDGDLTGAVSAG